MFHDTATSAILDALRVLHASHDALLERVAERYGIGRNDLRCLEILEREGPMRPQQLAERSRLSPAAITKVADRLVRSGFAARRTDEADRRGYVLGASSGHARLRTSTWDAVREESTAVLAELSPDEAAAVVRIATALTDVNLRHTERLLDVTPDDTTGGHVKARKARLTDEAAPALTFDPYDVVLPDERDRWVAGVEGPTGQVRFGHLTPDGGLQVSTLPRTLLATTDRSLDWEVVAPLMDLIESPELADDRDVAGRRVAAHLTERFADRANWPRLSWTVSDTPVTAAVLHFGGAWLAITDELPDAYLAVVGTGADPDGLRFTTTRGERYGVDFTAPILVGQMNHLHRNVLPEARETHPDLVPFLGNDA